MSSRCSTNHSHHPVAWFFILTGWLGWMEVLLFSQVITGQERYIVTTWTGENGLPQDAVVSMLQSRSGYMWLGTALGLVRFDGVSFQVYNRWNIPGLSGDSIISLYENRDGILWAGTEGAGLACLEKGQWKTYTRQHGLADNTIRAICSDIHHSTWAGTDNGLIRVINGKIDSFDMSHGLVGPRVTALVIDRNGKLWIGTSGGLNFTLPNRDKTITIQPAPFFPSMEITALYEDSRGVLWIGTENGLFRWENNELQPDGNNGMLPQSTISAMIESTPGHLWIGTYGEGIFQLHEGKLQAFIPPPELAGAFIHTILPDQEGNIWFGTTSGLTRLKPALVHSFTTANGLPESRVHSILQDHQGDWWIGTDRKGLVQVRDGTVLRQWTTADGLTSNLVRVLYQDAHHHLWVGTQDNGLTVMKFQKGQYTAVESFTTKNGLNSNHITAVFIDHTGCLWVGTAQGLNWREDSRTWRAFPGTRPAHPLSSRHLSNYPLSNHYIRAIVQGRDNGLRVATREGLFLVHQFKPSPIYPPLTRTMDAPAMADILSLYEDNNGNWWAGTNGSGLLRLEKKPPHDCTIFTTTHGLPSNYVFNIIPDSQGYTWFSSFKGVYRISLKELEQHSTSDPPFLRLIAYDQNEGMPSAQCSMTGQPSAFLTSQGQILVPTAKGLAIFHSTATPAKSHPPTITIENVLADDQPLLDTNGHPLKNSVPTGTGVLEFHFNAFNFSAPEKIQLFYKLQGYDTTWKSIPPRQKRTAFYLNLPPGNYRFDVAAGSPDGAWNVDGPSFAFTVGPTPGQNLLIYSIIFLLIAALTTGVFILFNRRRRELQSQTPDTTVLTPDPKTTKTIEPAISSPKENKPEKYKTSALLPETVESVMPRLIKLMEEEHIYLDPDLNLKKLSQQLHVHYNHLSQIINERIGKSFNDYINYYRIQSAVQKLSDPAANHQTILEIAYDTGFYSKSVFNTAFKKFTGKTPSQFRKDHLDHSPDG